MIHVTQGVSLAVLTHHIDPEYLMLVKQSGIQGVCVIGMTINTKGVPEDLEILRSAGSVLDNAAMEGVKQWRYQPFSLEGKPVAIHTVVNVRFDLH